jgi:hypothetical protein
MEHWYPPQYSSDGEWWWDGYGWVAVGRTRGRRAASAGSASRGRDSPRRRTPPVLWIGLAAALLLLLLAAVPSAATWFSNQAGLSTGAGTGPAQPAPVPTGAPTPPTTSAATSAGGSASPGTVAAYRQTLTADIQGFQAAEQRAADVCAPSALLGGAGDCRTALQTMDDAVGRFQSDLDANPVPGCLQPADTELRSGLGLSHQAIQQELSGLDHGDPGSILQGAAAMSQATAHLAKGSTLLSAC